jgi:hypothetical protein
VNTNRTLALVTIQFVHEVDSSYPWAEYTLTQSLNEINKSGEMQPVPECIEFPRAFLVPLHSECSYVAVRNIFIEYVNLISIIYLCILFSAETLNLSYITSKIRTVPIID